MKKFAYIFVEAHDKRVQEILDSHGKLGWELVSVCYDRELAFPYKLFFRREIE